MQLVPHDGEPKCKWKNELVAFNNSNNSQIDNWKG